MTEKRFNIINFEHYEITDEQRILARPFPASQDFSPDQLPAPVVEYIYSYLSLEDRYNMSKVCRSWNNEFECRSIWRYLEVDLCADHINQEHFSAVYKFGEFFRPVQIVCPGDRNNPEALSQLKQLLKVLTSRSQLYSISFKYFKLYLYGEDLDIMQCMLNFIESQIHLKEIAFDYCYFSEKEGYQIFTAIAKHCTNLKKIRHLRSFNHVNSDFVAENKQIFGFFMGLTAIEMDANIFEDMIVIYSDIEPTLSPLKCISLKSIKIYFNAWYEHESFYYPEIDDQVLNFKKQYPELKFDVLSMGFDVETLLNLSVLKNMDIRSLQFVHDYIYDIGSILKYLNFNKKGVHLEILEIRFLKTTNNVVQDLISLLQICPNLRELILEPENSIIGGYTLFDFLMNNYTGSLKKFYIEKFCRVSQEDKYVFYEMKRRTSETKWRIFTNSEKLNIRKCLSNLF